jgi:hypothetical protein
VAYGPDLVWQYLSELCASKIIPSRVWACVISRRSVLLFSDSFSAILMTSEKLVVHQDRL